MKYDYDVIVIGGGSGGLVTASGCVNLGAKVALIEYDKMGGDCLNTGCVPSKSFLNIAHAKKDIQKLSNIGANINIENFDLENVMKYVKSKIEIMAPNDSVERFQKMGVDVFLGKASFLDKNTVNVNDKNISAKKIVIATGSKAKIPNIKGLSEIPYLTNKNIFDLKILPKNLIILGAGPIGLELGQGFSYIGSKVTIIDRSENILKNDDSDVSPFMIDTLKKDGIDLKLGYSILEVKKIVDVIKVIISKDDNIMEICGENILVATGRTPNTNNLNLEKIGVDIDKNGFIITNSSMKTNIPSIYACGDVVGPYLFTHMAGYQASVIVKNIVFKLTSKFDIKNVAWTTFTYPEVAQTGYTENNAIKNGLFKESIKVSLSHNDRAIANEDEGFLKLVIDNKNRVIGATLISKNAGEMIPIASLAIKNKMKSTDFLNIIFPYPTESSIFMTASLEKTKKGFKDWQKQLVEKIFIKNI